MNKTFNIDFWGKRKIFFGISIALIAIGLIFNIIVGTKLDIQFAGGAMIKYEVTGGEVSADEVSKIVKDEIGRDSTVTVNEVLGSEEGGLQVTISFAGNQALTIDEQREVADVLTEKYDKLSFSVIESSSVDPTMGAKFFQKCLVCLLITFALLLIYIGFRFKNIGGLSAGLTALAALLHDVLITYFVFVIFGMPINDVFIAVILTILGYSLNDTIVIYDRIRENKRIMGGNTEPSELMNLSLNQTFKRSILTSVTTFLALLVVFIVATLYGLTTVVSFALPMMVGVAIGCYSSLVIAAPLYTMWQYKKRNSKKTPKSSKKSSTAKVTIK